MRLTSKNSIPDFVNSDSIFHENALSGIHCHACHLRGKNRFHTYKREQSIYSVKNTIQMKFEFIRAGLFI
jgi:hypothetical protein